MNYREVREEELERAYEALSWANQREAFQPDAALTVLLGELKEWLEDDRQWVSARGSHWVSLLDDLAAARIARGPALQGYLEDCAQAWDALEECRKALAQSSKKVPDPALRRRLQRSERAISARLEEPDALIAVWQDVLTAKTFAAAAAEARCLFSLLTAQGHSAKQFGNYLRDIIADDLVSVRFARGEKRGAATPNEVAGLSPRARVELVAEILLDEASQGEMIVWLRYGLADIGVDKLQVGETVTFYRREWLAERLERGPTEDLPPELRRKDPYSSVDSLAGVRQFVDDDDENDDEEVPYVVVRVELGRVRVAEAVELAQENAEVIVSLSTLHGGDPSIWVLAQDYATYRDGKSSAASLHAPNVKGMTLDQRSAIYRDAMPEVFDAWGEELEQHLPLERADLRRAAQLTLWLRRARETWEPGRLVLCDRIFEQVAGWAGVADRRIFIDDYLRLAWAMGRVRLEVNNCWSAIATEPTFFRRVITEEAWEEIKEHPPLDYEPYRSGWRVNLRGVMGSIDFLRDRVDPDEPLYERLTLLRSRTNSGKALTRWIKELLADFDAFESRSRRVRNSLIHGGPLSAETARSVLAFVDWLAADALHTSIRGLLREEDLVDRFLDRRESYERSYSALGRNEEPAEAFFWGEE